MIKEDRVKMIREDRVQAALGVTNDYDVYLTYNWHPFTVQAVSTIHAKLVADKLLKDTDVDYESIISSIALVIKT